MSAVPSDDEQLARANQGCNVDISEGVLVLDFENVELLLYKSTCIVLLDSSFCVLMESPPA